MNFGHSADIDFDSFAYPYPGRSAKMSWACCLSGVSVSAKKLIARVRPGVEETRASRDPSRALIKLDFPTFDRPRKATSGAPSGGNCVAEVAERRNFAWNLFT
jgi:hypothetical protein